MTYYVSDPQQSRDRRQRMLLIGGIAGAVAVVVLLIGALVARPSAAPAAPLGVPVVEALRWDTVAGQPVPVHRVHGPGDTSRGVARGFSHDELGAVLAAIHISARLAPDATPQVYEAVAREQCFGDVELTIASIRVARTSTPPAAALPQDYHYKITTGDPSGEQVLVSLAVTTEQGRAQGGFVGVTRSLRWVDGDWKMQVPVPAPSVISSVEGYTALGAPRV